MATTVAPVASTDDSTQKRGRIENLRPRWQKGQSGNPSGRRDRGLVAYIKEQTGDGREIIDYVLSVLRDERASTRHRLQAAEWLSDRAFGRPRQEVELRTDEDSERHARLAALSPQERAELRVELLRRLEEETRDVAQTLPEPDLRALPPAGG